MTVYSTIRVGVSAKLHQVSAQQRSTPRSVSRRWETTPQVVSAAVVLVEIAHPFVGAGILVNFSHHSAGSLSSDALTRTVNLTPSSGRDVNPLLSLSAAGNL